MFMITKDWLHSHKTRAGAWNRKQIEALGLKWPTGKGWQRDLIGSTITEAARLTFEGASNTKPSQPPVSLTALQARIDRLERGLLAAEVMIDPTGRIRLIRSRGATSSRSS